MLSDKKLHNLRHSTAHLLAQAVLRLFPKTKLTLGPVTKDGFFYDFLPQENFKDEDLPKIEAEMHRIIKEGLPIIQTTISKDEAKKLYVDNPFKLELINSLESNEIGLSKQGNFFDMCKGGHLKSTKEIKCFQLTGISGAYWRADKNSRGDRQG